MTQSAFAAALLAPDAPTPPGLSDPKGRPAGKRFDIYRNNVVTSLTAALETAFPVVRKLVGPANFKLLAGAFLRRHPPRTPVLMLYGADLPRFLETWPPVQTLGYLPDIARLEQALREAYPAADAAPLDPTRLAALAPDALMEVRFTLAPAFRLIRSPWPIHAIWRYNTEPGCPKPGPKPQDVAVLRDGYDPEPILLPDGAAAFLAALATGETLGTAMETATAEAPEFDLGPLLAQLLATGTITELETHA